MAAGDLITTDWEMEFRELLMGGATAYSIVSVEGLLDVPEISTSDQARLRRHGLRPGDDFLGGRTITVTMEVYGDDNQAFALALKELKEAFRPGLSEAPVVFQFPNVAEGAKVRSNVRARAMAWPITQTHFHRLDEVVIEFYSTDPRVYSNTVGADSATLPTAGGGLSFDASPDFSFGATSTGGELTLTNSGNFQTPVAFRIDGPVQTPRIIHEALDQELELDLTLATGEFIILDSESRTVLLGGTASRYSSLTTDSSWFDLEPGVNIISFRGASTAAGSLSATFRSAWV